MNEESKPMSGAKQVNDIVIKFVGDSGDGIQLSGNIFADTLAHIGLDMATFPDFPAEVRAPRNTTFGVSGFQIHFNNKKVLTPGDEYDVLVCFNPASLKVNLKNVKQGGIIVVDSSNFTPRSLETAGYTSNPLDDNSLSNYIVLQIPASEMVINLNSDLDKKNAERTKNMFILGLLYNMFSFDLKPAINYINTKFKNKSQLVEANLKSLEHGYQYSETIKNFPKFYLPKCELLPGKYRDIQGNVATAWGLMAAAEKAGLHLFVGSYPITPATEILVELSKHRELGVKTFQAEDEIAGITSAIGASFAGSLAATTTSGPGLSLKVEAMGLAVMTELPLVIVDVQRAGPSTGMPTKSEQADLYMSMFGRNGEAPIPIIAAASPVDCFFAAFEAAKIALEHMTPVILLSDGYIGLGSSVFRIPKMADLPEIRPPFADTNAKYYPYERDEEWYVRKWAIPGTPGLQHRVGGLEKSDIYGEVTTDAKNHEKMVINREEKIKRIAHKWPLQRITGPEDPDLLVVSWGGTKGQVEGAVQNLTAKGYKIAHTHFRYINPLPLNTHEILKSGKKVIVCELNRGQFANILRMNYQDIELHQYNKVQGQPFTMKELENAFTELLNS